MISAAPGANRWFHQHFGSSNGPLRLMAWYGPNAAPGRIPGIPPGEKVLDAGSVDIPDGGTAIPYYMEDPHIREEYEAMLAKAQRKSDMDPSWYKEGIKADFVGV
jgi:hypothetical protein